MKTLGTGNAVQPGNGPEPAETEPSARGKTASTVAGQPAPRLPHERDESSDSGAGAPGELTRRAHDDAVSGKTATDKGEATDVVYRRNLRSRTPGSERDGGDPPRASSALPPPKARG